MEFKKDNNQISKGYEIKNNALLFGSNNYLGSFLHNEGIRILKRTERIATAVYLVTECIQEDEPLREKIRNCALNLVSSSHTLLLESGMTKFSREGDLVVILLELRSFVSLGVSVALVSSMNGLILNTEITALIQDIEAEKIARLGEHGGMRAHERHKEISLTKEMFEVPTEHVAEKTLMSSMKKDMTFTQESVVNNNVLYKGHDNSKTSFKGQVSEISQNARPISNPKNHPTEPGNSKSDIAIRLGRRNTILKLIKDRREVTIKDVSSVVPDVSEKTIQRELLNLVSENVLKKTGEKRWSRYSLKS